MTKRFSIVAGCCVAVLALGVSLAHAGSKVNFYVTIDSVGRTAYGAQGSARNTADTVQRIYCRTFASTGGESVSCFATNNASPAVYVSCSTTNLTLVRSAQSVSDDAYIYFAWNANGQCTAIDVLKGSHLPPKTL